ncbi:MAG: hypothetical protein HC772_05850 [Leptolyngbyaceae cyanobacterium CRU_2_3]|nr:hypothetical protein [Leptolyngbyaceae cyanobacterium CRU_2_3]
MPRLIGKQANGSGYMALLLLISAGAVGAMEYVGAIDIVPNFGREWVHGSALPSNDRQPGIADSQPSLASPDNGQSANGQRHEQPMLQLGNPTPAPNAVQ